jgi:hypothetical protein
MAKNNPTMQDAKEMLVALFNEFRQLSMKVDLIAESNERMLTMQKELDQKLALKSRRKKEGTLEPDAVALLSLPAALRKTVLALYKFDRATADDLADETKRLRAVESASANQLVRMGYLKKKHEGRKVYFYIDSSLEANR